MKHYGDITMIHGSEVEPVNVVIGGSPCQDLSIAGKRAGLAGERSGLFMEQIRIVKELRKADEARGKTGADVRPRFMVWENVPGAFSSNHGEDFAAVLQETVRVAEPKAPPVPVPDRGWPLAGCVADAGGVWSVAWRVLDAQFWGVPQRRRRISLVADFAGERAPEILFERESVPWDYPSCGAQGQGTSCDVAGSPDEPISFYPQMKAESMCPIVGISNTLVNGTNPGFQNGICFAKQSFSDFRESDIASTQTDHIGKEGNDLVLSPILNAVCYPDVARAITARYDGSPCLDRGPNVVAVMKERAGKAGGGKGALVGEDVAFTLATHPDQTLCCPSVLHAAGFKAGQSEHARSIGYVPEQAPTLGSNLGGLEPTVFCIQGNCIDRADTAGCNGKGWKEDQSYTLNTIDRPAVVYDARGNGSGSVAPTITGDHENRVTDYTALVAAVDCRNASESSDVNGTLQAKGNGGISYNLNNVLRCGYCVRRMTPIECERLQGYPDGWTDIGAWVDTSGKNHAECTDSQRYKALGNSIALPPWLYVLQRLSLCCDSGRTMASLFDGIGGFPLLWEYLNGKGTCLWASEIEEFPIAVTKRHFAMEDVNGKTD